MNFKVESLDSEYIQNLLKESVNICHKYLGKDTKAHTIDAERGLGITCGNLEIGCTFQIVFEECIEEKEEIWYFAGVQVDFPDDSLQCEVDEVSWGNGISEETWDEDRQIPLKKYAATLETIGMAIANLFEGVHLSSYVPINNL